MIRSLAVVACLIALGTLNANAEGEIKPQFDSEQVLEHFQPEEIAVIPDVVCPVGSVCLPKRQSRDVCVGSDSACEPKATKRVFTPREGFNLLITFELGSDNLSKVAMANLREFAEALNAPLLQDRAFSIDGHTDARGAEGMNTDLSERRARVVVDYLASLGVSEDRLIARGYGESRPRIEDDPFSGQNRRVEATMKVE